MPVLVGVAGGSGSGKTWLAEKLVAALGSKRAVRLSIDDFYRDQSHLALARRAKVNFDNPRAIDWETVEECLEALRQGRDTALPAYDFATHTRRLETRLMRQRPFILVDGLWLWRRPTLRRLFALKIFIRCPEQVRLERRLERDVRERGRTPGSVREQFRTTVAPMHDRFVAGQERWADVVLDSPATGADVQEIARQIESLASARP